MTQSLQPETPKQNELKQSTLVGSPTCSTLTHWVKAFGFNITHAYMNKKQSGKLKNHHLVIEFPIYPTSLPFALFFLTPLKR